MAVITVVTEVKFGGIGVDVEPVGIAEEVDTLAEVVEEDDTPAGVAEKDDTPANILFKLVLTLNGVYVDMSKRSRYSPISKISW